jgi:hypothetical protein
MLINKIMDSEPSKQKNSDLDADVRHVLQPDGFRHSILHDISTNWFLWNYHVYFLPIISCIVWALFLLF